MGVPAVSLLSCVTTCSDNWNILSIERFAGDVFTTFHINTTHELIQDFMSMLRHREGDQLDTWLENVRNSQICEFQRMVHGIERDKAAVLVGLTLSHSNGVVKGKVHQLKFLKRMEFGRAGFALLHQRVLHAL